MNILNASPETLREIVRFERLVTDISTSFINVPTEAFDSAILRALRHIVEGLGVDRSTLTQYFPQTREFISTHCWVVDGLPPVPRMVVHPLWPWCERRVRCGKMVVFSHLDDLPPEAAADKVAFHDIGLKSHVSIPLQIDNELVGLLSFGTLRAERSWSVELLERVRVIGEIFAGLLARKRAQAEVAQYQERLAYLSRVHAVGEMSAAIAHEVNQPLMAIKNYALAALRRLKDNSAPPEKQQELLDKIVLQATRAGDVIDRLRSLVRKHNATTRELDLNHLVIDTLKLVEMDCRLRDIRLEKQLAADLPLVVADDIQIQQVILNLVRNAIEAMALEAHAGGGDPRILIETARTGPQEIEVRVIDSGPGIGSDEAEQIFESFHSTKAFGLGIGLSICRKIIEIHAGRLWTSPNPAGGAVFHFTLPVAITGD